MSSSGLIKPRLTSALIAITALPSSSPTTTMIKVRDNNINYHLSWIFYRRTFQQERNYSEEETKYVVLISQYPALLRISSVWVSKTQLLVS